MYMRIYIYIYVCRWIYMCGGSSKAGSPDVTMARPIPVAMVIHDDWMRTATPMMKRKPPYSYVNKLI